MNPTDHDDFVPTAEAAAILDALSVQIKPGVAIGYPDPGAMLLEAPVLIRPGTYDVDFIGAFSFMGGRQTELRYVSSIGRFCSIAYNIMAGVEDHAHDFLSPNPLFLGAFDWKQLGSFRDDNAGVLSFAREVWRLRKDEQYGKIAIGSDVWIGEGVLIRRGVTIGDGAVIASRAVVTKDVPPYAIVGGTPAKVLRYRFEPAVVDALLELNWWSYGLSALHGVDMTNINKAIDKIDANIASGRAQIYETPLVHVEAGGDATPLRYDRETGEVVAVELDR